MILVKSEEDNKEKKGKEKNMSLVKHWTRKVKSVRGVFIYQSMFFL